MIVAEVLSDDGEWVELLIRESTVVNAKPGWVLQPLPKGETARRKRHTIERGTPARLLWSDEAARAFLVSRATS